MFIVLGSGRKQMWPADLGLRNRQHFDDHEHHCTTMRVLILHLPSPSFNPQSIPSWLRFPLPAAWAGFLLHLSRHSSLILVRRLIWILSFVDLDSGSLDGHSWGMLKMEGRNLEFSIVFSEAWSMAKPRCIYVQGFSNTRQSRRARTSSPGADSNMQMNQVTQTWWILLWIARLKANLKRMFLQRRSSLFPADHIGEGVNMIG